MAAPRGNVAPVCHVFPQPLPGKPTLTPLPAIPPATDLQSGLQAINLIRQSLNIMFNQINQNNITISGPSSGGGGNVGIGGGVPGVPISNLPQPQQLAPSNFIEIAAKRIYKTIRVFGMTNGVKDPNVWVDVKQIVGLTFVDKITEQEWIWNQ